MGTLSRYSFGEIIHNAWSWLITKLSFPGCGARLIRQPSYIRGKEHLLIERGFTTGYACRFDLGGKGKTLCIGANCKLGDRVHIVANQSVTIGSNVLMASNIFISDTSHGSYGEQPSSPLEPPDKRELVTGSVRIEDDVWVGEGVCILPNVIIGRGSVIGANAVVTKDIPPYSIAAGVPARILKRYDFDDNTWKVWDD